MELYAEDGLERPFCLTLNTPYDGNVVKITNTGPVEYPLTASVVRPRWREYIGISKLRWNTIF